MAHNTNSDYYNKGKSNMMSRLTSPKLSNASAGSMKPPMPQSNMKRSAVMASKGDTEPTVAADVQTTSSSLFGGVLSKVFTMIGETT
jgi:hypothetical protein